MTSISFTIPGKPVAKGRPRASSAGGFAKMYADKKTAIYENLVRLKAEVEMNGAPPFTGPIIFEVVAYVQIPVSKTKKIQEAMRTGLMHPTGKSDLDNYVKSCSDGCNAVVFADDAQIVELHAKKVFSDRPRLWVRATELEPKM